jgi:serine/threonine-protein kinase
MPPHPEYPTEIELPAEARDESESNSDSNTPPARPAPDGAHPLRASALGSGLLAKQPTPEPEAIAAVAKVCPQCGTEYETGSRFCIKDGSPLRPKAGNDPLVGRVIADRYLMLARLGEGSMERVYLAEHVKMNRQCAVKVMNPSLVNDHESVTRFAREASSAARILHPNVATVFDFGESERIVYLVMEYVDGEPLSHILAHEGHLEARRAVDIARQIADGLAAAHELGIVHRDLKPDNVIITQARNGRDVAKIVDFGIAKAISESQQDALTRSGLVIGTPEYMSPEQLLGDPVDARADVYSLGSILFQMLTGAPAFADDTREQMIRRRLHEAAPHVRDVVPELPRRLDTVIAHMLARSPADRLASASEARDALDPALVLAEWAPSASTIRRSVPLAEKTRMTAAPIMDPGLQPTMPITRQRMSIRRIVIGSLTGSALIFAFIVAQKLRDETPASTPQVQPADSAAVAALTQSAAPRDTQPPAARIDSQARPQVKGRGRATNGAPGKSTALATGTAKPTTPPPESKVEITDSAAANLAKLQSPPPLTAEERAIRRPLQAFADAIKAESMESMIAAYPHLDKDAQKGWKENFGQVSNIRAHADFSHLVVTSEGATIDYTLNLEWKSATSSGSTYRYTAVLVRRDGQWEIASLAEKR